MIPAAACLVLSAGLLAARVALVVRGAEVDDSLEPWSRE